jgi:hypothetical protein
LLQRLRLCRPGLLIVTALSLLLLAPMELLTELDSYLQIIATPADTLFQSNLLVDLTRPNLNYPGELMLAAKLAPVANYFSFVLKQVNLSIVKFQSCKVMGIILRLHLGSLVILLFYIFYLNSRTATDADSLAGKRFNIRKAEAFHALVSNAVKNKEE